MKEAVSDSLEDMPRQRLGTDVGELIGGGHEGRMVDHACHKITEVEGISKNVLRLLEGVGISIVMCAAGIR